MTQLNLNLPTRLSWRELLTRNLERNQKRLCELRNVRRFAVVRRRIGDLLSENRLLRAALRRIDARKSGLTSCKETRMM